MAKTTDELFAEATEADYETVEPVTLAASDTEEEFQFRIDEHLRTIAIPEKGVVAGVEGDLNVNIARFVMVRYYHGRDLSKLNIRINYRNANGQVNYYTVSDATVSGDSIVFSWEYAADVTQYKGNVQFVVYLFSATNAVLKQRFFTTLGTLEVLEGLEVDSSIPASEQTDILLHLKKDLAAYAEEVKKSLPADYTAMTEQVSSLKEDLDKLNEGGLNLKDEVIEEDIHNWLNEHPEATTTVQDKSIETSKFTDNAKLYVMKDYVTPEMFGAVGDGSKNASPSINAAIDYAFNNGIGTVLLRNGVYLLDEPITMKSGITLKGEGNAYSVTIMGTNNLEKALSLNISVFLLNDNFEGDYAVIVPSDQKMCTITNLVIVGNGKDKTSINGGIALLGNSRNRHRLDTVSMTNLSGTGVYVTAKEALLEHVCVIDCSSNGIIFDNTEDCTLENILCGYCEGCGIQFLSCFVMAIRKADVFYNTLDGIYSEHCRNICIDMSQIDRSGNNGLQLKNGEDNIIISTRFAYNSYLNESRFSDIYVNNTSNTMIFGCTFYGKKDGSTNVEPSCAIKDSGTGNLKGTIIGCTYRFNYSNGFLSDVVKSNYKIFDTTSQSFHSYIKNQMNSEWVDDGIYLVKTDKQCELTINAHYNGESIVSGSDYIIATIPDDAKPKKKTKVPLFRESTGVLEGFVSVRSNEIVYHALSTQKYVTEINISYITN